MNAVVVDTNVILVEKGMSEQACPECVAKCQERLNQIIGGSEKVVIDDNWIILSEYLDYHEDRNSTTHMRTSGSFLDWFIRNHRNPEQCLKVTITPTQDGRGFEEFPDDPALHDFDPDDRKFIAVVVVYENTHQEKALLLQALDSQWYGFREAFIKNDLEKEFICEENIRHLYERHEKRQ